MNLPREVLDLMDKLDSTTYNHSFRLWELAMGVEGCYHMTDETLSTAAFVHDIGKLFIPSVILDKREGFSNLEREIMDLHSYYGYRILEQYRVNEVVKRIVLWHHGLQPKVLLPLPDFYSVETAEKAKMLHTLDVFEALTTDRPYRRRLSVAEALSQIEREKGYHSEMIRYLKRTAQDF